MKFFNIDMHISVIADLKQIFTNLGHQVNDKSLSSHGWVFGRPQDRVSVIDMGNFGNLGQEKCDEFYSTYKDELKDYDGFICTYPPAFSLLYEKFEKPIILQIPIRFECTCMTPETLKRFIEYLRRGIDDKRIIATANSRYDKYMFEKYVERPCKHIPNLCEYTWIACSGYQDYILYSGEKIFNHPRVFTRHEYLGHGYSWQRFNNVAGCIHYPYNVSTMSIFEQYTGNVPLFFPSLDYCLRLYKEGKTMSQVRWDYGYPAEPEKFYLADFYDSTWMPHITYFDSEDDLCEKLNNHNSIGTIMNMYLTNEWRKQAIYQMWKEVLNDL